MIQPDHGLIHTYIYLHIWCLGEKCVSGELWWVLGWEEWGKQGLGGLFCPRTILLEAGCLYQLLGLCWAPSAASQKKVSGPARADYLGEKGETLLTELLYESKGSSLLGSIMPICWEHNFHKNHLGARRVIWYVCMDKTKCEDV